MSKHKIKIEPAGLEFEVYENETILDAARNSGIAFPYRCCQGMCTACVCINKNQGRVSYAGLDPIMSEEEKAEGFTFCCIGYALSDLVLYHPYIDK